MLPAGVEIGPALPDMADALAADLRPADRTELTAASGRTDYAAMLHEDLSAAHTAFIFTLRGELGGVFGWEPAKDGTAGIWALGTSAVDRHAKLFVTAADAVIATLLDRFTVLHNVVHARNIRAVRWLRYAGAVFGRPLTAPESGELFIPFFITEPSRCAVSP